MCAHVSADEQFSVWCDILKSRLSINLSQNNSSEAVRQNPDSKAWNQACDQGVVLLSTASVNYYLHMPIVLLWLDTSFTHENWLFGSCTKLTAKQHVL